MRCKFPVFSLDEIFRWKMTLCASFSKINFFKSFISGTFNLRRRSANFLPCRQFANRMSTCGIHAYLGPINSLSGRSFFFLLMLYSAKPCEKQHRDIGHRFICLHNVEVSQACVFCTGIDWLNLTNSKEPSP